MISTGQLEQTYNLTIDGLHTYLIGKNNVVVHNSPFCAAEVAGLKQLFGQGMSGARAAASKFMTGNGALPAGVTTATLQAYKAAVTAAGPATANAPVNVLRLFVVDTLLGLK